MVGKTNGQENSVYIDNPGEYPLAFKGIFVKGEDVGSTTISSISFQPTT